MGALSQKHVGDYLNKHFVSSYQKVATFTITKGGAKQGGNVAGYFCTPDGHVLHLFAGPINGNVLLEEARWVVENWKLAQMLEIKYFSQAQTLFRMAHLDRLSREYRIKYNLAQLPPLEAKSASAALPTAALNSFKANVNNNQARIHQLLAAYPLPKIARIYELVFEDLLNENVSTVPVVKKN